MSTFPTFPHVVVFTDFFSLTPETPQSSCSSQSCIRFMISHNLESLALYFQGVLPNVLPLASLVIKVEEVRIGGHRLLSQLVNCLSTPKLKKLSLAELVHRSEGECRTRSAAALNGAFGPLSSQYTHLPAGAVGDINLEEL